MGLHELLRNPDGGVINSDGGPTCELHVAIKLCRFDFLCVLQNTVSCQSSLQKINSLAGPNALTSFYSTPQQASQSFTRVLRSQREAWGEGLTERKSWRVVSTWMLPPASWKLAAEPTSTSESWLR